MTRQQGNVEFFNVERPVFESVLISLQREIGHAQKVLYVLLSFSP